MTPDRAQRNLVPHETLGPTGPADEAPTQIVKRSCSALDHRNNFGSVPRSLPTAAFADNLKGLKAFEKDLVMRFRPSRCRHLHLPFLFRSGIDSGNGMASRIVFSALCCGAVIAATSGAAVADRAKTRSAVIAMLAESKALSIACDDWVWSQARAMYAVAEFDITKEELVAEGLPVTMQTGKKYSRIGRAAACRDAEERYGDTGEVYPGLLQRR